MYLPSNLFTPASVVAIHIFPFLSSRTPCTTSLLKPCAIESLMRTLPSYLPRPPHQAPIQRVPALSWRNEEISLLFNPCIGLIEPKLSELLSFVKGSLG